MGHFSPSGQFLLGLGSRLLPLGSLFGTVRHHFACFGQGFILIICGRDPQVVPQQAEPFAGCKGSFSGILVLGANGERSGLDLIFLPLLWILES